MAVTYDEYIKGKKKSLGILTEDEEASDSKTQKQTYDEYVAQKMVNRLNSFYESYNTLVNEYNTRYSSDLGAGVRSYRADSADWLASVGERTNALGKEAEFLKSSFKSGANIYDEEWIQAVLADINSLVENQKGIYNSAVSDNEYWSQWESEEAYIKALEEQKQYEETLAYDLSAGQAEIDNLQSVLNKYYNLQGHLSSANRSHATPEKKASIQKQMDALVEQYGGVGGLSSAISQKQAYHTVAERNQRGVELSSVVGNEDFDANSGYVSTKLNPKTFLDKLKGSEYGMGYGDLTYEYINGDASLRDQINQAYYESAAKAGGNFAFGTDTPFTKRSLDEMNEDEIKVYNYYYNTEGKEKAEEFLDSIVESLNYRRKQSIFESVEGKTGLEMVFGIVAGLDQYAGGVEALLSNKDYIPTSAWQYASGMVREDLADNGAKLPDWLGGSSLGQVAYDAITTTSNMLPSIVLSFVPVVGQVAGAVSLGASAAGHAKAEMLNLGYSKRQANLYGAMVGASEAGLQYLLGGITRLGGVANKGLTELALSKVDNALARVAITLGMNMASEGLEESLQTVIEPWLKSLVTGVDFEAPNIDEVLYSGLLGAISSLGLEGVGTVTGGVAQSAERTAHGQSILDKDGVAPLLELAKNMYGADEAPNANKIQKLASKVEKNATARNTGKLSAAIEKSIGKQDAADLQKALVDKGMSKSEARSIADALTSGEKLSAEMKDKINSSREVAEAFDELRGVIGQRKINLMAARMGVDTKGTNATSSGELSLRNKVDVSKKVAEGGNAVKASTGEAVVIDKSNTIAKVATVNGERVVYYNTDKGVVPSTDIEYASEDDGLLYESFSDMNPAFANSLIKNYDGSIPVMKYVNGMREGVILYGMHNFQGIGKDIRRDTYFSDLSEADQKFALELGREYAKMETEKAESDLRSAIKNAAESAKADGKTESAKGGSVRFDKGVDGAKLNRTQRRTVSLAKYLAKAIGIDIVFYDAITTTDKNGKKANGYFDPKDNSIHLDLQNALSDSKTIVFTLSHELVHFIKKWSPQKFKTFSDFLMEQYAEHGVSTAALLERKMGQLGIEDADVAFEEMIADACERMLLDSNAAVKLMELRKADLDLFEKIKLHIAQLLTKLRDTFRGVDPNTDEGIALQKMEDVLGKIHEMFEDAAVDAANTYQEAAKANAAEAVFGRKHVSEGEQDFSVKQQLKDSKKIGDASIAYNDKHNKVNAAVLKVGVDTMVEMAEVMMPYLEQEGILPPDIPGKTIFKNGSYGRTGENTTLCVRTLTYEDFKDRVSDVLGRPLTVAESLLVSQKIYDIATDPQCIYCYVAADRKAYDEYLGEYHRAMDKYIKAMRNGGDANALYEEYLDGRKDTAAQQKRWAMWKSIANSGKSYISAKDLATRAKRDMIISEKGDFATQVKDAQRYAQSASWAKTVSDYRAYKGDILKLSQTLVDTLNSEYGLRMYSFSDYTPAFIVENMQMIIDAAARGLKSLAYTKDTAYAKIFAPTGQAINVSCFAKYDPETKSYVEDSRQGASWAETKALRDKFRNVGAVMVCTNDEMVAWAMRQDWVDVIIPYHIVKTGTTIANEYAWRNYTAESSDRVGNKTANIYPTEHNNDFATYQKLVNERGITPRFDRFYQRTLNGEFTKEQYMKLVNEVRLPASELSAVVPMFDLGEAKKSFGVDENGNVIEGGFVDKGGYMGGWYRAGVDVNQEVLAVKKDIEDGKSSLDVDYGMNKQLKEKQIDKYGIKKQAKSNPSNPYNGKTMYIDGDIYDYSFMTSLDDMKVESMPSLSDVKENGRVSHGKAIKLGLENAKSIGRKTDVDQYAIKNAYTGREIILGRNGLKHSLYTSEIHRLRTNARLSAIGASIVQNAVPINGLKKENPQANGTYAMACLLNDGTGYVVAIVTVDEFASKVVGIDAVDITHSINGRFTTKKEDSRSSTREKDSGEISLSNTTISEISIADFLEIVNSSHRSILSDDILRHFGEERPPEGYYADRVLFQKKTVTNRELLANALESTAQNDIERNKIAQYKEKISLIESEQAKLTEIREKANELRFTKGRTPDETKQMKSLDLEARQIENRINIYDRQLLNLESTAALKNVLQREKEMARKRAEQKGKEALQRAKEKRDEAIRTLMQKNREARARVIESRSKTEIRNKIKDIVSDLNTLLLNPTKDKHVPIGLQKPVAAALDIINMDTVGAEQRLAEINKKLAKANDPAEIEHLLESYNRISLQGESLADKLTALKAAYAEIKNSEDQLIKNSHNEAIENLIENTIDVVGNTSIRDMSLKKLEAVYDMFKAIKATVRNANKLFKEGRQETVTENSEKVKTEVKAAGGHRERVLKATKWLKKAGWDMLKPLQAMRVIGSNTFAKLFENVRKGEDTWAVDVNEAKNFFIVKSKQYGYDSWDFKKQYTFNDSTGNSFSLSLEQIMSLYAYSKREQADLHLEKGGFIFDDAIEVTEKGKFGIPMKYEVNDANPYRLRKEDLGAVINVLETDLKDVKGFVDDMQAYLSDVMGAKGNEVSLAMYDIKLYNEKHYFPLKTARYFREFDPEKNGTPKIRNSGFSKKTVPKAGNPIVLSNFMDVWANHVNDMSMYHAFVLPLEDFMRVYNYSSTDGGYDSVQQYIKNAYGSQANQYIERLMEDLNGGARVDPSAGVINKGIALFKKSAVFASASVVIQQPSAIARATAYVSPKYFIDKPVATKHKETWAEVKKYAPVAVIKEMGYFDTNMGRSTVDWIIDKKTVMGKIDDIASKAPAFADELAWCAIWKAVKREVADTTKLKVGSEEFLKRAGERFTEVVTNTQVYDSVLSRSGMMRSKDTGMKMATAFMAEPTTSLNMVVDAIIQGKRGNKKFAAKTIGAVAASVILNSILVSLVYAARDDDEDETYTEKYLASLTSELIDGFNPLTYIPFVKDIWSIAQGYDVERSDMSVVGNLWESIENLFSDNKSGFEKVEGVVGAIASIFGLPLKNLVRDARGMYNLTTTLLSGTPTTKAGVADAVGEAAKSTVPLWTRIEKWTGAADSKSDKLYDAIMSGDSAHTDRLKGGYKDDKAVNTAIRAGLRDNDARIAEAVAAYYSGDVNKRIELIKEIEGEGNFTSEVVRGAINNEITAVAQKAKDAAKAKASGKTDVHDEIVNGLLETYPKEMVEKILGEKLEDALSAPEEEPRETTIYRTDDIAAAFESGDNELAKQIIGEFVKEKTDANIAKARKEAESEGVYFNEKKALEDAEKKARASVKGTVTSYWKPIVIAAYESKNTSEKLRIRDILWETGLYGKYRSDVRDTMEDWYDNKDK